MQFHRVVLRNVRILENARFEPSPGLNYFTGPNGAGKTSLLEGLHTLSTGSSFRTNKPANLIRHDQPSLQVFAEYAYRDSPQQHTIGVERTRKGETRVKIDREPARRLADLTQKIPVLALHPESHQLINGGPSLRRKVIDWGVFHVEQRFIQIWRDYKRLLEQRNAALKQGVDDAELSVWDTSLVTAGQSLHASRSNYLQQLQPHLTDLLVKTGWSELVDVSLYAGWNTEYPFADELQRVRSKDKLYRTTSVGPHRAELILKTGDEDIRHVFSRGQQKLFIYILRMAQANHIYSERRIRSVFLCDDLPAELDEERREHITRILLEAGYQVFATSVYRQQHNAEEADHAVFHVEHGDVHQVV